MRSSILIAVTIVLTACGREQAPEPQMAEPAMPPPAPMQGAAAAEPISVQLQATQGNAASGVLSLTPEQTGVHFTGTVTGLEPGSEHGIHIHEKGDCSAPDASSAGEHFAPMGRPHGAPGPESHVGDLGNITANEEGTAEVDVRAPQATLRDGAPADISGKAVIVHAGPDDMQSQPSGNAGARIACGVIR